MPDKKFIIGSRGSELALWQTNHAKATLETHFPDTAFEIKIIKTTGDQLLDVALSKIGDKGLFTKQIENALLRREIDLAVHSLKDLQTVQPEDLEIGAVSNREIPNDVLISKKYASIDDLPEGAKVATGSLRRKSQLLHYRPDLNIFEIRGNVPTRLKKFEESDLDGGCQVPIGANAVLEGSEIHLEGMVGNLQGSVNLREKISGDQSEAENLGKRLAESLIEKGANKLLELTREKVERTEEPVI